MEKFLYIRTAAVAVDNDDNDDTGGVLYPISHFKGMHAGTCNAAGTVTGSNTAFTLHFRPLKIAAGYQGGDSNTTETEDRTDKFTFNVSAADKQIDAMKDLVSAINADNAKANGFITLYDGGNAEYDAVKASPWITTVATVVINETN